MGIRAEIIASALECMCDRAAAAATAVATWASMEFVVVVVLVMGWSLLVKLPSTRMGSSA